MQIEIPHVSKFRIFVKMKDLLRIILIVATIAAAYSCSSNRRMTRFEVDYMVSEADRMIVLDDLDSAALLINNLARQEPEDTIILWRQGIINRDLGTVEGRIKSERAFRKLVKINSKNAKYHLELAKTLIAQSFEMQGRSELTWAIELDPTIDEAYLLMTHLYRRPYFVNDDRDRGDSARYILEQLLLAKPVSDSGLVLLAELCAVRNQFDSATWAASKVLEIDSTAKQANMVMGYADYRRGQFESAANYFERGLNMMDSTELTGYESVLFLIPPQNATRYMQQAPAKRDSLREELWFEIDLDPTTPVNERRVEHYARVWLANLLYTDPRYGVIGWTTDMGETLIRLGLPDDRYRAKIQSGRTNGVPAWYWYYTTTEFPCTLAFVDHMLSGTFRFPFSYSDNTGSSRANSSKEIAYLNYRQIPQESTVGRERLPVNLFAGAYTFASNDSLTEVQIITFAPAADLLDENGAELRIVIQAENGIGNYRTQEQGGLAPLFASDGRDSLIGRSSMFSIEPGSYRVGIALEQPEEKRFGVIVDSVVVPDYRNGKPSLSDIVLGSARSGDRNGPGIVRGDSVRIVPSIDQEFSTSQPLRLYYEIYNLPTDIRSLTRFDVTYTFQFVKGSERGIKSLLGKIFPGRKESVSYTYREGGKNRTAIRDVELNLSELRPGRYVLTIAINDLVLGAKIEGRTDLILFE